MATIRICDCCHQEMNTAATLTFMMIDKNNKNKFQHSVESKSSSGGFDVCKYCIIDAINKVDDRPREG